MVERNKKIGATVGPQPWANRVTKILDAVLTNERYPVKVSEIALELSRSLYPQDPIELVYGDNLPGFDGSLFRLPQSKSGWRILYNNNVISSGRINFTLAHEFGHYLVHRERFPDGFRCGQDDIVRWDPDYKAIENEANTFAAYLLMPFHDYRKQIPEDAPVTWQMLSECAHRYGVSLVAATLRWLEYTNRRAVLVLSREGFVLWAKSSKRAFKSGIFLRTKNVTVETPSASPAARDDLPPGESLTVRHDGGVWFRDALEEAVIRSDAYDFTMSLLLLGSESYTTNIDEPEDEGMISVSQFISSPFSRTP